MHKAGLFAAGSQNEYSRHRAGFRFGDWAVLPQENRLVRGNEMARLEPKVMQLLLALVHDHGRPCTRHALLDQLWPSPETGESSLTRAISELRKALGDQRNPPQYIDTIHRVGYKAIADIGPLPNASPAVLDDSKKRAELSDHQEVMAMARYLLVRRNAPDIQRAIRMLDQYIAKKPYYAQLWALLAHALFLQPMYTDEPASLLLRKAREHASKALDLDGANGLAWAVLGALDHQDWQWQTALEQYERAYAYQPNDQIILHGYAELCLHLGRIDQAIALMQRGCQLEPLAASGHLALGWMLLHREDHKESGLELRKARRLGAKTRFCDNLECLLINRSGWSEQSISRWKALNSNRRNHPRWVWPIYIIDALIGDPSSTEVVPQIRERVLLGQLDSGITPFMLTLVGELDAAFEMAEIAVKQRRFFIIDPWLDEMAAFREDARFSQLLNNVGIAGLV